MTVRELLDRVDSREITEWKAFYMIENEDRKRAQLEAKAAQAGKGWRRRR